MQKLWAPWRGKFILGEKEKGCIFCKRLKEKKDDKNLILFRGEKSFIIMNRFPYNTGHLMVCPNRHTGTLENLTESEMADLMKTTQVSIKLLKSTLKPEALNLGMNLGKVSGAGVANHLHIHIVPRWTGDTNFMPVLAETKVVSISLGEVFRKLKKNLREYSKAY
jgi:ATP adenylyltransferase